MKREEGLRVPRAGASSGVPTCWKRAVRGKDHLGEVIAAESGDRQHGAAFLGERPDDPQHLADCPAQ